MADIVNRGSERGDPWLLLSCSYHLVFGLTEDKSKVLGRIKRKPKPSLDHNPGDEVPTVHIRNLEGFKNNPLFVPWELG
jgi:hypothetical protein